jgi:hypothetical protein
VHGDLQTIDGFSPEADRAVPLITLNHLINFQTDLWSSPNAIVALADEPALSIGSGNRDRFRCGETRDLIIVRL